MAGVFPGQLGVYNEGDVWANKLTFVAERGFHGGSTNLDAIEEPGRREVLERLQSDFNQSWTIHYKPRLDADPAAEVERLRAEAKKHIDYGKSLNFPAAQVVVPGGMHRFNREFPIGPQLDRLEQLLTPLADVLGAAGIPLSIENHADYYVSDLVELCQRTPGLTIMLDTGNSFLIGERPDLIPDEAYPLIATTHFKDHYVAPVPKELHFQLTGATLGEGHAGLEAIYQKLLTLHPDPRSINLMIEWVPDPAKNAVDCFNESLRFLQRLSGGNFTPNFFEG